MYCLNMKEYSVLIPFQGNLHCFGSCDAMKTPLHDCFLKYVSNQSSGMVGLYPIAYGPGAGPSNVSFCDFSKRSVFKISYLVLLLPNHVLKKKRKVKWQVNSNLCVVCLRAEHAWSAHKGADFAHCEWLPLRTLCSCQVLFEEGTQVCGPRSLGPTSAESGGLDRMDRKWTERRGWRWALPFLSPHPLDLLSGVGSTLSGFFRPQVKAQCCSYPFPPPHSPAYEEMVEVVIRGVAILNINWQAERKESCQKTRSKKAFYPVHFPSMSSTPMF